MRFLISPLLVAATLVEASFSASRSLATALLPETIQLRGGLAFPLTLSDGTLRVYYQANDTSLHSFEPFGLPSGPGVTPTQDVQVVSPGIARVNTPLAAVDLGSIIGLYFFAGATGNVLNEAGGPPDGIGWTITALGSQYDFTTTFGNQFLYAFPWPAGGPQSRRVGFPFANGSLGEAICETSLNCWFQAVF